MGDDIHKTHFTVPEMPYKKKEREAILLLQKILCLFNGEFSWRLIQNNLIDLIHENHKVVDWVMKYKGE